MSGKQSAKRNHLTAIKAARLRREGHGYKQIADATGLDVKVVPARIALGERLLSLE